MEVTNIRTHGRQPFRIPFLRKCVLVNSVCISSKKTFLWEERIPSTVYNNSPLEEALRFHAESQLHSIFLYPYCIRNIRNASVLTAFCKIETNLARWTHEKAGFVNNMSSTVFITFSASWLMASFFLKIGRKTALFSCLNRPL